MFGIDIIDASLGPSMFIAMFAGVISFLSPCVFPVAAPYMAYIAGANLEDGPSTKRQRARIITSGLFFVLGLSTVFLLLGWAASAIGQVFLEYQRQMGIVAGAVVFLFGLHFLGVIRIPFLNREARIDTGKRRGGIFGAYVLGLAFAFGWTPCIGPILGTVLSLAAQEGSADRGMVLMAAYAIGLGVPFLLVAVFLTRALGFMSRFKRHLGKVEKVMGGMLVGVGVLLMTGAFTVFSFWLLDTFPALSQIG